MRANLTPLTSEDYYSQSAPFRHWLYKDYIRSASGKPAKYRLEDLSSEKSHALFDRFIKYYNDGSLAESYYDGSITSKSLKDSGIQTKHAWGFKMSAKEAEEASNIRGGIDTLTNGRSKGAQELQQMERKRSGKRSRQDDEDDDGPAIGPSRPSPSSSTRPSDPTDLRLAHEESSHKAHLQAQALRRTQRRDEKERQEELHPRETGRDARIEKKRERNRSNREFEAGIKGDDTIDADQLMKGDVSFQEALAASKSRSSHKGGGSKVQEARELRRLEKEAEMDQKREAYNSKEAETMKMLKELAQSRFG